MTDPDWLDEREQRAWRGFMALNAEIQRRLGRQLQIETGLTMAEYAVLASLSEAPGGRLRVFQLRAAADWEKTRLTHQITRMTARGLVAREPCADDPRGAFVVLTEAGWEAITAAAPRHVAHVRHWFFDALAPGQVETLLDVSRSVIDRLPEADQAMFSACAPGGACSPGDAPFPPGGPRLDDDDSCRPDEPCLTDGSLRSLADEPVLRSLVDAMAESTADACPGSGSAGGCAGPAEALELSDISEMSEVSDRATGERGDVSRRADGA